MVSLRDRTDLWSSSQLLSVHLVYLSLCFAQAFSQSQSLMPQLNQCKSIFQTCFMSYDIPSTPCTSMPSIPPSLIQFQGCLIVAFSMKLTPYHPNRISSLFFFALIALCSSTKLILIPFCFGCLFAWQSARCNINFLNEEKICSISCMQHSVVDLIVAQYGENFIHPPP